MILLIWWIIFGVIHAILSYGWIIAYGKVVTSRTIDPKYDYIPALIYSFVSFIMPYNIFLTAFLFQPWKYGWKIK